MNVSSSSQALTSIKFTELKSRSRFFTCGRIPASALFTDTRIWPTLAKNKSPPSPQPGFDWMKGRLCCASRGSTANPTQLGDCPQATDKLQKAALILNQENKSWRPCQHSTLFPDRQLRV